MTEDTLRRLRERLDPARAEGLARLHHELSDPRSLPWEQLPFLLRARLTEAMKEILGALADDRPHLWSAKNSPVACVRCGAERRRDGHDAPCPGKPPR